MSIANLNIRSHPTDARSVLVCLIIIIATNVRTKKQFVIQNVVKTAARTEFHDEGQFWLQTQTEELHHVLRVDFTTIGVSVYGQHYVIFEGGPGCYK